MWGLTARPYLCGMGGWVTGPGPRVLCGHPERVCECVGAVCGGGREYVGTDCAALFVWHGRVGYRAWSTSPLRTS